MDEKLEEIGVTRKDCKGQSKRGSLTAALSVDEFSKWKATSLGKVDLSKKGSVDEQITGLVGFINSHDDYFTTSSCSGRILVCSDDLVQGESESNEELKINSKRDCVWYFVSHTEVDSSRILEELKNISLPSKFKFEPFVLHVQCRTLESAKILHRASVEAGFRNSGISFGKGGRKIIAAVRGTACLEAPVTDLEGNQLVSHAYINYMTKSANQKLKNNLKMIAAFEANLVKSVNKSNVEESLPTRPTEVYRKKGKRGKMRHCSVTNELIEIDSSFLFDA